MVDREIVEQRAIADSLEQASRFTPAPVRQGIEQNKQIRIDTRSIDLDGATRRFDEWRALSLGREFAQDQEALTQTCASLSGKPSRPEHPAYCLAVHRLTIIEAEHGQDRACALVGKIGDFAGAERDRLVRRLGVQLRQR